VKILLVDDDPTALLFGRVALRQLGHECDTVIDGDQAWESFQSDRPDVVISDWMMPGLNGLELCRNIRADSGGGYPYVILLTSKRAHHQILEGMTAGADDYLIKPLDPAALQSRLIAAARVTSLHRQLTDQRTELEGLNLGLTSLAQRDPLTGLSNRRVLQEDLEVLEARVVRYGYCYCMALLDIDHFKSYNDSHGHQAGDHVLRTVSAQLKEHIRTGDALYRYGGEEFLCILPEQALTTGIIATQRMRLGVQQLAIHHDVNSAGVVTLSAGVAMLDPDHIRPAGEVLREADQALYRAKQLGRNRVENLVAVQLEARDDLSLGARDRRRAKRLDDEL
jgi:two-component system chemotaxis response regulator CheY